MPAGTETSVTAMRGTLLNLLSSPSTYQKLKQEIADGIKEGRISKPITCEEAKSLPYLQVSFQSYDSEQCVYMARLTMYLKAVIYEGMRMVPPVINGFEKTVPPGGDTSESCLLIWHSLE